METTRNDIISLTICPGGAAGRPEQGRGGRAMGEGSLLALKRRAGLHVFFAPCVAKCLSLSLGQPTRLLHSPLPLHGHFLISTFCHIFHTCNINMYIPQVAGWREPAGFLHVSRIGPPQLSEFCNQLRQLSNYPEPQLSEFCNKKEVLQYETKGRKGS